MITEAQTENEFICGLSVKTYPTNSVSIILVTSESNLCTSATMSLHQHLINEISSISNIYISKYLVCSNKNKKLMYYKQ